MLKSDSLSVRGQNANRFFPPRPSEPRFRAVCVVPLPCFISGVYKGRHWAQVNHGKMQHLGKGVVQGWPGLSLQTQMHGPCSSPHTPAQPRCPSDCGPDACPPLDLHALCLHHQPPSAESITSVLSSDIASLQWSSLTVLSKVVLLIHFLSLIFLH